MVKDLSISTLCGESRKPHRTARERLVKGADLDNHEIIVDSPCPERVTHRMVWFSSSCEGVDLELERGGRLPRHGERRPFEGLQGHHVLRRARRLTRARGGCRSDLFFGGLFAPFRLGGGVTITIVPYGASYSDHTRRRARRHDATRRSGERGGSRRRGGEEGGRGASKPSRITAI